MPKDVATSNGWTVKDREASSPRPYPVPSMADTGELDLRGFVRTVLRRKFLLLIILVAGLGAAMCWIWQATPRYSADVLIVIEARPSSIVKVDQAVEDVTGDSDTAKVNTEVAVLKSRGLATKVIDDLGLENDPEFNSHAGSERPFAGLLAKLRATGLVAAVSAAWDSARIFLAQANAGGDIPAEAAPMEPTTDAASLTEEQQLAMMQSVAITQTEARAIKQTARLDRFLSHLTVVPESGSRLVRIGFTSTDPTKAARIANKVVEEYIENQLETKSEGARRAAEWLQARLIELGDTVRSLQDSVREQRTDSGSNAINTTEQRLTQLNSELVVAQANLVSTKARYRQVRRVLEGGGRLETLPSVIASPTVQGLRSSYMDLSETLSEHLTEFGEKHPTIVSLRAEMTNVKQRLHDEIATILEGLRNEVRAAELREEELHSQLEAVDLKMIRLKEAEASIAQVAQRLEVSRDLYESLLKRHTEAVALRDNQQPDARIISSAQIPLSPSYPSRPRVLALSLLGSASFAVFLVVLLERLRPRLDSVEDVERQVGLQVIGAVPDLPRLRRMTSSAGDYMHREPLSEFGGAFQRLRALLTLGNDRKMPRTVLVTSGSAGEGKTTIALCLAIASVSSGQRVLLVDCDFSRPQVHRVVDVKNRLGLTDILRGTATLQETVTHTTGYSLSILTIGQSREGAIDLLNSGRMEELLAEFGKTYDTIILDSAPVLEVSNALILGGLADKTVLVTRREWTTPRNASYAVKQLQLYGADIAGLIVNRSNAVHH